MRLSSICRCANVGSEKLRGANEELRFSFGNGRGIGQILFS